MRFNSSGAIRFPPSSRPEQGQQRLGSDRLNPETSRCILPAQLVLPRLERLHSRRIRQWKTVGGFPATNTTLPNGPKATDPVKRL
jgi:hypothetical protein